MPSSQLSWVGILLPGVSLVAGAVLFILGMRGRRLNNHPICRRCGFDLFGSESDAESCPECGNELAGRRAVIRGERRRRGELIVVSIPLLLLGIGMLGFVVLQAAAGYDWQRMKPVAWLRWEAKSSGASGGAAVDELLRRQQAGELTATQLDALIEDALSAQADAARPWDADWGDIVQTAKRDLQVDNARWTKYAEQAITAGSPISLEVRPRVRRGESIPYRIHRRPSRVGDDSALPPLYLRVGPVVLTMGESTFDHGGTSGGELSPTGTGSMGSRWQPSAEDWARVPIGRQTIRAKCRLTVLPSLDGEAPPLSVMDVSLNDDADFVEEPTVRAVRDVAAADLLRSRLSIRDLQARTPQRYGSAMIDLKGGAPVGFAYELWAVAEDGRRWRFGATSSPASAGDAGMGVGGLPADADVATVNVHLVPSAEVASTTVDVVEFLDHELIFEDVEVARE